MNLRLYDSVHNHVLVERKYPHSNNDCITENTIKWNHNCYNGFYKEIYFEGVHIGYGDVLLRQNIELDFESDIESIEMHFALKGYSVVKTNHFDKNICFNSNQHNIIYAKEISGNMQWDNDHFQLFEINFSPSFFKRFLPEDHHLFDTFRNVIEKGNSGLLAEKHNLMSHNMFQIIEDIISCERQGVFKRMYLEAKVIELLVLQLEQFSDENLSNISIKKTDMDKIYAVREYILKNLNSEFSLIELAHLVGTNEFILKFSGKSCIG